MRQKFTAIVAGILCIGLTASCSRTESPAPVKKAPAPKVLIGLPPERNIFRQIERYEPLAAYLGRKAGVRIELKVLASYDNVISDFQAMNMAGAFFGSLSYVIAHERMGLEAVARPENMRGGNTYQGLIFVRKNSGIRMASDMKGKRLALVGRATLVGCLLPRVYFKENGVEDYRTFVGEAYYAGTHEDVIRDVLDGKADIGAAKNTVLDTMIAEGQRGANGGVRVLAVSPQVPENVLALRPDLDAKLAAGIREALLTMDGDAEGKRVLQDFGARRFIETGNDDYKAVYRYAEKAGVDPATLGCLKERR
ncbi:MAG: phosphate/phosphite/phosphonate ABC transporter substrate-binding protein [Thermodesulfobacteriota bacterium]